MEETTERPRTSALTLMPTQTRRLMPTQLRMPTPPENAEEEVFLRAGLSGSGCVVAPALRRVWSLYVD